MGGSELGLEVRESKSPAAAHVMFGALRSQLGTSSDRLTYPDEAFAAPDGRVVVRRDTDVLIVDPRQLPDALGDRSFQPDVVATAAVETILECWR